MNTLLTQYNIRFSKQVLNGKVRHIARGGGVAEFLNTFIDPESINEGLLNINYYLSGGVADYNRDTVSTQIYSVWLDNFTADIYPSVGNTEQLLQSVPLQDFKTILELWLNFLKS